MILFQEITDRLIEFLLNFIDFMLFFRMASIFLPSHKNGKIRPIVSTIVAAFLADTLLNVNFSANFYTIIPIVILSAYSITVFSGKAISKILIAICYYFAVGLITFTVVSIITAISGYDFEYLTEHHEIRVMTALIIKAVTMVITELVHRLAKPSLVQKGLLNSFIALAYLITNLLVFIVLFELILVSNTQISGLNVLLLVGSFLGMLVAFMIGFNTYFKTKSENVNYQMMMKINQLKESATINKVETDIELLKLKHDLKNHLQTIQYLINNHKIEQASAYLNDLSNSEPFKSYVNSKNEIINAILNTKITQHRNIKFTVRLSIDRFAIQHNDLTVIMGNALDNAIEASEQLETAERQIKIYLSESKQYCKIKIINQFLQPPKVERGLLISSKNDQQTHGLGFLSMSKIAEKYDGTVNFRISGNEFIFTAILDKNAVYS